MKMKPLRSIAVIALLFSAGLLRAADPFLGKWVLDTRQSRYAAGTCPRQMTIEMTAAGRGVHYHSETVMQNGKSFAADYVANYDGTPSLVSGAKSVLLPVSLQKLGPRVVVARYTSGLEVRATSRRSISADGTTMTVKTTSSDGSGAVFTNIGIYRRSTSREPLGRYLSQANVNLEAQP